MRYTAIDKIDNGSAKVYERLRIINMPKLENETDMSYIMRLIQILDIDDDYNYDEWFVYNIKFLIGGYYPIHQFKRISSISNNKSHELYWILYELNKKNKDKCSKLYSLLCDKYKIFQYSKILDNIIATDYINNPFMLEYDKTKDKKIYDIIKVIKEQELYNTVKESVDKYIEFKRNFKLSEYKYNEIINEIINERRNELLEIYCT